MRCASGLFINNNGIMSSTVARQITDKGVAPIFNGATTNNIRITREPSFDLETKSVTVSAWVKFASVGAYRYIVSDYNAGVTESQYSLMLTNTSKFSFFWARTGTQGPNPFTAASTTTAVANVWYHVCGVRSGTTGSWNSLIYVNGVRENSTATTVNPARLVGISSGITIGAAGAYASGLTMNGNIMNVMIYDRNLTDTEIRNIYTSQKNLINNWGRP